MWILNNQINSKQVVFRLLLQSITVLLFVSCKTGTKFEPTNAEEVFNEGLRLFNEREYQEAMSYMDMIKLQYPGSGYADKAQYYTAEINFIREEYILSSFHYSRVRTTYPGSEFAKISLYKAGLSQYLMVPDHHKDQEYTAKAIKTLQDYQFFYPDKDSLYNETEKMIVSCRNRLGEKDYQTAELYTTLRSYRSALIYYESVIRDYEDTQYFEPAWYGKIFALYQTKQYEEAQNATLTYNNLFPNGAYKTQIEALSASPEN